jgi:hypothetical protein
MLFLMIDVLETIKGQGNQLGVVVAHRTLTKSRSIMNPTKRKERKVFVRSFAIK